MKQNKKNAPKNYQISENIMFTYWNENEWEFTIDHRNLTEEKSTRMQVLAAMLTMEFSDRGVPAHRINDFAEMSKQVFAL